MKITRAILTSILVGQFPSRIQGQLRNIAERCLPRTEFDLFVNGPCNYQSLLHSVQQRLESPDPVKDSITPCPHSAAEELLKNFPGNETDLTTLIGGLCKDAQVEYDTANTVAWSDVTQKGEKFDKEYYDGNGDWNEEHQSNYPHSPFVPGQPSNVLNRDAENVDDLYEGDLQRYPLEWPGHLSNFENCLYNSAMCCWPTDRQANDHNGNCATPYDENCLDADPGDNTDLCAVDMTRSIKDSVHVDGGFALFPEDTEGPIHCHGLAWGDDETEADTRFRANNLFFVSMSDHMHDRGYVRAVQGAPMCACVENMPIVSRSDCTEIKATEFYKFTFPSMDSESVKATLDYIDIDYNACQAPGGNNNLERFHARLLNEGRLSQMKYSKFRETVVGHHECPSANSALLFARGYVFDAPVYEGWTQLYGRGSLISSNTEPTKWNDIDEGSYVRRVCKSCHRDSHKDIIYKRLTSGGTISFKNLFLANWFSNPEGGSNIRGQDFNLFSSMEDAKNDANPWQYCNYNHQHIGFPRDCGPTSWSPSEWNSVVVAWGEADFAYYLYTGTG